MPLDDTNFPQTTEVDETTALLPPEAASDDATRLLIRARSFLERGWGRNADACDVDGREVSPTNKAAIAWCAWGALVASGMPRDDWPRHPAILRLKAVIGDEEVIGIFNDHQETVET